MNLQGIAKVCGTDLTTVELIIKEIFATMVRLTSVSKLLGISCEQRIEYQYELSIRAFLNKEWTYDIQAV